MSNISLEVTSNIDNKKDENICQEGVYNDEIKENLEDCYCL